MKKQIREVLSKYRGNQGYTMEHAESELLNLFGVSGSCSCGVKYVETKKSDIPYDTDDNVYYTDIMIYHCPKCGNIDRIEEY